MALWLRFLLVLAALAASTAPAHAVSAKERRAFAAAAGEFQAGLWNRADAELARFLEKFPNSTNASQAVLMQAQAEFHQAQFSNAIVLLQRNLPAAGPLADQFVYWIGEARFAAGDYPSAEKTFASLVQQFPNSPLQARAIVEQAAALADQNRWRGVIALLAPTNGLFQAAARANPDGDTVSRGRFYLAQAFFSQRDFSRELSTLDSINSKLLPPPLDWKRQYMLYQLRLSTGDLLAALSASTNLLRIAALQQDVALVARTRALRGGLFEQMGRTNDALAEYQQNLTNAPVGEERQAIFKIAALSAAQGQFTNAEGQFRQFLLQFSNAPAADVALLTLGELRLKSWDANPAATNDLLAAQARFGQLISGFTNSLLLGQAFLDRGWTFWFQDDYSNSAADFGSATRLLQPSDDLAVAKFKLADSLFAQNDFSGAWGNYRAVLRDFTNFPAVQDALAQRALYQSLQASLRLHDFSAAADALSQLLLRFPSGEMTSSGRLLYGESQAQAGYPLRSRRTFEQFEAQYPNSPLLPRAAFAAARTYELQNDWSNAVAGYQQWLKRFPASPLRPRVAFALARANSESGNETRAAALFAGFTTRYPTNALAAQAFWWLGDHFFNLGGTNYVDAEENYEFVYQNFPDGPLAWPARWMAGRAATARQDYAGAIRNYFQKMENDTNCPEEWRDQAVFAHGAALMQMDSPDTNNPSLNFQRATNVFAAILQSPASGPLADAAQIEIGKCDFQMNDLPDATNAYAAVFQSSNAPLSLRDQARVGFGMALEKQAALLSAQAATSAQTAQAGALLHAALDNYLDVFETGYGKNLRDGETADPFWVKKAGLQALPLIESLNVAPPDGFITQMEELLPQLKDSLEKQRAALQQ